MAQPVDRDSPISPIGPIGPIGPDVDHKQKEDNCMPRFDDLRITTMVVCFHLQGEVGRDEAFHLLPLTTLDPSFTANKGKKNRVIPNSTGGEIISLRYEDMVRGVLRTNKTNTFGHCIALDIMTKSKSIAVKLSARSIHMCGATSNEMAYEAANYLINHLLHIQKLLDFIKNDKEAAQEILAWVSSKTKGECLIRTMDVHGKKRATMDHHVLTDKIDVKIAPDTHRLFAEYLLANRAEIRYHSDYRSKLNWIFNTTHICTPNLSIQKMTPIMVNYNYRLPFPIHRHNLRDKLNHRDGFFARYDNAAQHNVNISLPYTMPEEDVEGPRIRKRSSKPCHTFMVYQSGCVTQSGPNCTLMREAFDKFIRNIIELKEYIDSR